MLFENNDFDVNMALFIPDVKFGREEKLTSPIEGLERGNMFVNEYDPYKKLSYFKLTANSEKEKMLLMIMAYSFAINDLNLYLDLHPNDDEVFAQFKKYIRDMEKLSKEYEKLYGPLEITGTTGSKFNWLDSPWPWDSKGGTFYV